MLILSREELMRLSVITQLALLFTLFVVGFDIYLFLKDFKLSGIICVIFTGWFIAEIITPSVQYDRQQG
jgi:hypothetical protein